MTKEELLNLGCSDSAVQSILQCFSEQQSLHEQELAKLRLDTAVNSELAKVGAKNTKAVKALLDFGSISLGEDGNVVGLSEQLDAVRNSDGYLFNEPTEKVLFKGYKPAENMDGVPKSGIIDTDNMSYSQLSAFLGENPDFKLN